MADRRAPENSLASDTPPHSKTPGDVPESVRRRYYLDSGGGPGLGFFVDATVRTASFRDRGRILTTERSDPNVIRDLATIARHRGWTIVVARGSASFRREAWLAGRSQGLDVRGYRPTERDLQALEKLQARAAGQSHSLPPRDPRRPRSGEEQQANTVAMASLRTVEAVVRNRVADAQAQDRILAAARARLATWLERGPLGPRRSPSDDLVVSATRRRERQR